MPRANLSEVDPDKVIVFAYDPGLTTGWAMWQPAEELFQSGQVEDRHAFERRFDNLVAGGEFLDVVGEKYLITAATATKTRQYDALYINGYIDGLAAKLGFLFSLQTPTEAKKFSTDPKLKAVGWYNPTPGGHANDAARHLLRHLCARRHDLGGAMLLERIVEGLVL